MAEYQPPIDDTRFVLEHVIGLDALQALPDQEDLGPELISAVLNEAGKLAANVLAPLDWIGDRVGSQLEEGKVKPPKGFAQAYQQFAEGGWCGIDSPLDAGGQGLPHALGTSVLEYWQSANLAFALNPLLSQAAIKALIRHGSEPLRKRYLEALTQGSIAGTMNLTEPQAGSDLAALSMKAEPEGEHFRLYGQKIFITWGDHDLTQNIVHLVLARLPDAPAGVKGISLFLVPKWLDDECTERNDVYAVAVEHKLGIHASPTCVMAYGEKEGALGYLVGEPHQGLACMFTMMNHARQGVGVQGLGVAERAWQQARHYARDRVQGFGADRKTRVSIDHHADVQRMLLTIKASTEAMRALAIVAAFAGDQAEHGDNPQAAARYDLLTPIVKGWLTEQCQECTSLALQVHGGMGYIEETGIAQRFRDGRILPIYEGTTGIQAQDLIGRKVLADEGRALAALLEEIAAEAALAARADKLAPYARLLKEALVSARELQAWMLRTGKEDMPALQAASVPTLMLLGYLCGGWLLLKSARVARSACEAGGVSEALANNKFRTQAFYQQQLLSRVTSLWQGIQGGSAMLADQAKALFD